MRRTSAEIWGDLLPPALITASKLSRSNGSTPEPASAPNRQAEITLLFRFASTSMSKAMTRLAAKLAPSITTFGSAMASPGFSFSATA